MKTDIATEKIRRPRISRRAFIVSSAAAATGVGALVIGLRLHPPFQIEKSSATSSNPFDAWIHLKFDNTAELVLARSEMGQGVYTSLPMLLAEEAELDWDRVSIVQSDESYGTGGSGSVRGSYLPLRQAGAVVREAMITAAAYKWSVPREECVPRKSEVIHQPSGQKVPYGDLIEQVRRLPLPDAKKVKLKDPGTFTLLGREIPHLDIPSKVFGAARFGLDVRLPGMVYAVIARCPTFGGVPSKVDATRALATPGVLQVFEIPARGFRIYTAGGVVVVAKTTWAAMQGRNALSIVWDHGPHVNESTETINDLARRALNEPASWSSNEGPADPDVIPAAKRVESIYQFPFLAHATMEPMNITIHLRGKKCEAWCPSQVADWSRSAIAKELHLPESSVTVHTTFMGGGFGRRFLADFQTEAAQIALHVSSPVQLVWTREDDMTHDFYRPAGLHRLRGALDEHGNILAWSNRIADTSIRAQWDDPGKVRPESAELPGQPVYPIKHLQQSYVPVSSVVPRGWWRSVGGSFNGFVIESFIDELAQAAGEDPYRYRRRLLLAAANRTPRDGTSEPSFERDRLVRVLDLAAEKAGWEKSPGRHRGRGIACTTYYAYMAQVAEVTVSGNEIHVDRIVTVVDCGQVINLNGARSQLEGGTLFALSSYLKEAITIRNGAVVQQNFNDYDVLRISEAPELETYFVESHATPHGLGEAGVILPGAAVANAIFAATGKRLRSLPLHLDEKSL